MKVTVFNGSPRGKKGNTHVMVKEFSKGAGQGGAEVENVFLVKKNTTLPGLFYVLDVDAGRMRY